MLDVHRPRTAPPMSENASVDLVTRPPLRFWRYFLPVLAVAVAVFTMFPRLDLGVSAMFYDSARRVWPHARETSAQEWRVALNVAAWFVLFLVAVPRQKAAEAAE